MDFRKESLITDGFQEFMSVHDIRIDYKTVPRTKGVYIVYRESLDKPDFAEKGPGGFFKNKDPNVSADTLWKNWIDTANVLYIGQTGSSLRGRIRLYMRFGNGEPVAKRGGRLIWQLRDAENLLIAYKELPNYIPREYEIYLLNEFRLQNNGKLPFANLAR